MTGTVEYGVFRTIYTGNLWRSNESKSGTGSEIRNAHALIAELPALIDRWRIRSMLDIPCGDRNWMRHVDLRGANYVGADIVAELIDENRRREPGVDFRVLNAAQDPLPEVDLVFCRDLLCHLPHAEVRRVLENFRASNCRYILTTTFMRRSRPNRDVPLGAWHPLNLFLPPFNLPPAREILVEESREQQGADKCMALWDRCDIRPTA